MFDAFNRRRALALGGSLFGGSFLASLKLPHLAASELALPAGAVQFRPEIEPLVRIIEETPSERVLGAVAREIRGGRSYRECLAALFLAAIRNVQPRPAVGFKFHSVLVVNSAHLASLAGADDERWLPLFWAIEYFKRAQKQDIEEGNWTMSAVDESRVPDAAKALNDLRTALENWDVESADVAAAAAARAASAHQLFDLFAEFGSRDFRSIGHKAIYVAGAFRVLQVIGWEYAEPVMRSLAYALLNHTGDPNPAKSDLAADRQGRLNQNRATNLPVGWFAGKVDSSATNDLLQTARGATPESMAVETVKLFERGVGITSVYDGLFAASAELIMRQPAIVPLHAMTTTNAMHYLVQHVHNDSLRRWIVLQNAAFIGHFREAADGRGGLEPHRIDEVVMASEEKAAGEPAPVESLFAGGGKQANERAVDFLAYLRSGGSPVQLMAQARHLVFHKGNDSHDYKYSSAILEDYFARSPEWRDRILAAGSALFPSTDKRDTGLATKVAEAFG